MRRHPDLATQVQQVERELRHLQMLRDKVTPGPIRDSYSIRIKVWLGVIASLRQLQERDYGL